MVMTSARVPPVPVSFLPVRDGGSPTITPIYKRWTLERSPPELYNHGFENMESLGAVYSRVSSHIFGDWNACGTHQSIDTDSVCGISMRTLGIISGALNCT